MTKEKLMAALALLPDNAEVVIHTEVATSDRTMYDIKDVSGPYIVDDPNLEGYALEVGEHRGDW